MSRFVQEVPGRVLDTVSGREMSFASASIYAKELLAFVGDNEIDRLTRQRDELVAALRPFADCAEVFDDHRRAVMMPNSGPFQSWPRMDRDFVLTVEDLRNARAAIASVKEETK